MSFWQILLVDVGRVGIGLIFMISAFIDFRARKQIFHLMKIKNVPQPWFCYVGAIAWKLITSLLLILNFYTALAALLLAIYILIANLIFNNFWAANGDQRDFSLYLFLVYLASCCGLLIIAGVA